MEGSEVGEMCAVKLNSKQKGCAWTLIRVNKGKKEEIYGEVVVGLWRGNLLLFTLCNESMSFSIKIN
jgi:hypothetical protein